MIVSSPHNLPRSMLFVDTNSRIPIKIKIAPNEPMLGDNIKVTIQTPKDISIIGTKKNLLQGFSHSNFGEKINAQTIRKTSKNSININFGKIDKSGKWKFKSILELKYASNKTEKKLEKTENKKNNKNSRFYCKVASWV